MYYLHKIQLHLNQLLDVENVELKSELLTTSVILSYNLPSE